ncbi:ankyrin repeat domain-containing protein [Candidatus Chromulinivorax destructor]|uniref:Uncharacterized protein n=1 Tax=Candidatus Chromulinivorax destructor TaxID=2066483 RepID=A0A345ZAI4_9BACT|nr:ankyrin repeat domain-containing protein [Candidatus Chromulinivorax destructor]AXK60301.1 hypothetical protein C0J27_00855 [Candidatus Chromulinivorax destructor]
MKKIVKIVVYAFAISFINKLIQSQPVIDKQAITPRTNLTDNKNSASSQLNQLQHLHNRWKRKQLPNSSEVAPEMATIYDNQDAPVHYASNEYPLITAAKKNDLETIKKLLEQKVDVNVRDLTNKTAYDYAVANSNSWIRSTERKNRALQISKLIEPDIYDYKNPDGSIKEID